jgi:hypothetical protein
MIGGAGGDTDKTRHVHVVTIDTLTSKVLHTIDLQPDTTAPAINSDGSKAIVVQGDYQSKDHHLFLLDTETGKLAPLPSLWSTPADDPDVALSGDGHLISFYTESGPPERPLMVRVYALPTKTFVASQTSPFTNAGGILGGGVTEDGKAIEFANNRSGSSFVDLQSGRPLASFGPSFVRSPDGQWVVQLPNQTFAEDSTPQKILIEDGRTAKPLGAIDRKVSEEESYGRMNGAFCGTTGVFILAGENAVAVYAIPSGKLLQTFPASKWQAPTGAGSWSPSVACSPNAKQVAILSGTRLTLHPLE